MTDFMTARTVIFVQLRDPGVRHAKGVQFKSSCKIWRGSHKTQVWLCFLILSFLSISTCAASKDDARHFKICVMKIKSTMYSRKSDAMLYAPSIDDIKENCERASLRCYVQELMMVLDEEEITKNAKCVFNFNETLRANSEGCPACETYALENITTFLDRLINLLEKMGT